MAAMGKLLSLCRCAACPLSRGLIVTSRLSGGENLRQDRLAHARGYNGTGELYTYLHDLVMRGGVEIQAVLPQSYCSRVSGQRLRSLIPQYRPNTHANNCGGHGPCT